MRYKFVFLIYSLYISIKINVMDFKTLRNACEYSPDKALSFITSVYATLDSDGKAVLRAKFKRYFLDDGTLPQDPKD